MGVWTDRLGPVWDGVVTASTLAVAIELPAQLVLDPPGAGYRGGLDWALTILFAADLIVQLHRAGCLGGRSRPTPSAPISRLAGVWFVMDLGAAIPFGAIGAPAAVQLLRLLKLGRIAQPMWRWKQAVLHNPNVVRLVAFSFWLALSMHWIACGWLALRGLEAALDPATQYLRALYWCVTTLATVGYGDITPRTNVERVYAIAVMILGVGVYGYVIGNAAGLLANLDPARVRHRELVERMTAFMRYRRVPAELQRRVLDYYEYLWEHRLGYDESAAIAQLPPTLRMEMTLFLKQDVIGRVPLFREAGAAFIKDIALEMRPLIFMPGDYIVRAGEPGEEMYFISQGRVEVVSADGQTVYATLTAGDFFGEMALILRQPRSAGVRAVEYCDVYSLTRAAFERILGRHPEAAARIRAVAQSRQEENLRRQEGGS